MSDKLVLHPEEVRAYIGRLGGICLILDSVPGFLQGGNDQGQSVWLTDEELGSYQPFCTAWKEICDSRAKEARQIANFLRANKEKLAKAAGDVIHTDMSSAAIFPTTVEPGTGERSSLEATVESRGMDVQTPEEETIDRLGRNVPE